MSDLTASEMMVLIQELPENSRVAVFAKRLTEENRRLKEKLVIAKAALNNIACIDCWREDERCLDRECNLARVALFRLSDPKETEGGAK